MRARLLYLLAFIVIFLTACSAMNSSCLGRLFYPLKYEKHIFAYAEEYRVDPLLVAAVIHTESGFRPTAVSGRGARGLMQVMPDTAIWIAQEIGYTDFSPEMLFEPRYNIELGTWYLANLHRQFNGNTIVSLAAYNGGRGRVARWLEQGTWDGAEDRLDQIPYQETRDFVRRVMKAYQHYRQIYHSQEESNAYGNIDQR